MTMMPADSELYDQKETVDVEKCDEDGLVFNVGISLNYVILKITYWVLV